MNEKAAKIQEIPEKGDNPYSLAGWLAIVSAILFPLAFVVSIIPAFGIKKFDFQGPAFGPSDIIFIVFTVFGIYVLLKFRQFLNERYNYHGIDTLILISICWGIAFEIGMIVLKLVLIGVYPGKGIGSGIIFISFFALSMITIGVVDIFIAVKLLKNKGLCLCYTGSGNLRVNRNFCCGVIGFGFCILHPDWDDFTP